MMNGNLEEILVLLARGLADGDMPQLVDEQTKLVLRQMVERCLLHEEDEQAVVGYRLLGSKGASENGMVEVVVSTP